MWCLDTFLAGICILSLRASHGGNILLLAAFWLVVLAYYWPLRKELQKLQ